MRAQPASHPRCPCLVGWLAAVALLGLVVVPAAVAAPSAPSVASSVASPTNADLGDLLLGRGDHGGSRLRDRPLRGRVRGRSPRGPSARPARSATTAAGSHTFRVRAVQANVLDPLIPDAGRPLRLGDGGHRPHAADDLGRPQPAKPQRLQRLVPQPGGRLDAARTPAARASPAARPTRTSRPRAAASGARAGRSTGRATRARAVNSPSFNLDSVNPNAGAMRAPEPGRDRRAGADLRLGPGIRQRHVGLRPATR